jgi:hypothetical protein
VAVSFQKNGAKMSNQSEAVNQFIKETKHPLKAEIEVVTSRWVKHLHLRGSLFTIAR